MEAKDPLKLVATGASLHKTSVLQPINTVTLHFTSGMPMLPWQLKLCAITNKHANAI